MLRARAYLLRKDSANAISDLNYVLTFRSGDPDALILRGIAFTGTNDYEKALADLNQGLCKIETVDGYFARAQIYEHKNDVPHATADFRRAAELKPRASLTWSPRSRRANKSSSFQNAFPAEVPVGAATTADACDPDLRPENPPLAGTGHGANA
jgi:tetratricopeptide (TPR) repeat protein